MNDTEYAAICRTQRQAYFAWQSAPAGKGDEALAEYLRATKALDEAQKR